MQTTDLRTAPGMHFMARGLKHHRPVIMPRQPLPPRDIFKDYPEVLDAYDRMVSLNEAMGHHQTEQMRLNAEATAAEQQYHRDVRDAMATGKDVAKVQNHAPVLKAQADAHGKFHDEAKRGATDTGYELGEAIAQVAPDLFAPTETTLTKAGDDLTKALTHLRKTWAVWSAAFDVRRLLSTAVLAGGSLSYKAAAQLPAEVAAALATLEDYLKNLDRLKSDEANVRAWRDEQAAAEYGPRMTDQERAEYGVGAA